MWVRGARVRDKETCDRVSLVYGEELFIPCADSVPTMLHWLLAKEEGFNSEQPNPIDLDMVDQASPASPFRVLQNSKAQWLCVKWSKGRASSGVWKEEATADHRGRKQDMEGRSGPCGGRHFSAALLRMSQTTDYCDECCRKHQSGASNFLQHLKFRRNLSGKHKYLSLKKGCLTETFWGTVEFLCTI